MSYGVARRSSTATNQHEPLYLDYLGFPTMIPKSSCVKAESSGRLRITQGGGWNEQKVRTRQLFPILDSIQEPLNPNSRSLAKLSFIFFFSTT